MAELARWIWQGVALVAVVSACTSRVRGISASMRYRIWWATLALVLALPLLATLELPGLGAFRGVTVANAAARPAMVVAETSDASWSTFAMLVAGAVWIIATVARLYRAVSHLDAAKRACRPFPIVRERQLARWKTIRNRGRRATLVTSDHVRSAGVLGLGYPRIAVAPQLVSTLTAEELDQLVVHEYAHVQRRDDVAAMIQLLVRCLVGWHPAVWWIDRRLRIEREVACDDWVLTTTAAAPRTYARCLTRIAGLSVGAESTLVPAANRRYQLSTRVMRLLDERRSISIRPSVRALATATALLTVASIGLVGSHSRVVILPNVSQPRVMSSMSTPELTLNRLLDALHAPYTVRTVSPVQAMRSSSSVDPTVDVIPASNIVTASSEPPEHHPIPVVRTTEEPARPSVAQSASSADHRDVPPSAEAPPMTAADSSVAAAGEEATWIDNTRRALISAGKATGQSVADASVNTAQAVAGASAATYRGSQKSALKAGRFFSKLGKSLARPF